MSVALHFSRTTNARRTGASRRGQGHFPLRKPLLDLACEQVVARPHRVAEAGRVMRNQEVLVEPLEAFEGIKLHLWSPYTTAYGSPTQSVPPDVMAARFAVMS